MLKLTQSPRAWSGQPGIATPGWLDLPAGAPGGALARPRHGAPPGSHRGRHVDSDQGLTLLLFLMETPSATTAM